MIKEVDLDHDAVFRIGRVISVNGRRVRIAVDKLKNGSHLLYRGSLVRNVAVSSYIKIAKGFVELIAKVDGEVVEEDYSATAEYRRDVDPLSRQLDVSLIGYIEGGRFKRGVREMPLLDNECFILTEKEFRLIHTFVSSSDEPLAIGTLAMDPTQAVEVGVNAIFASHIGIFGNTGSGKSYTLAKLYHELLKKYGHNKTFRQRSQFVLIDFNGEYVNRDDDVDEYAKSVIADDDVKQVYDLSTYNDQGDRLPLPKAAVHDPVFWTVLLDATEKTQAPFISRVLKSDYWSTLLRKPEALLDVIGDLVARATKSNDGAIDRQLPINFLEDIKECLGNNVDHEDLSSLIEEMRNQLQYHSKNHDFFWISQDDNSRRWATDANWNDFIKSKVANIKQDFSSVDDIDLVRFKLVLQYYWDVISGFANREHLGPMIKRLHERVPSIKLLIRVSDDELTKVPLTVVSLRNVNLAMRKVIPMILCKHLYDNKKRMDTCGQKYLNLIIDEAHNILSLQSSRESEAWRDYRLETFEEIVKEGRKFGVFLTLASQRPHDISPTIISQLHNYFIHRLVNDLDVQAIEKAVTYLDRVSFESLPILPTGTCVLAGVSVQVPVITRIGKLPPYAEPNSRTMSVTTEWRKSLIAESESDEKLDEPPF
ncbi:MAG: ATP-binding protein [Trueperella sp.]|nr:ATP-binding protein [Trueperella sp.]